MPDLLKTKLSEKPIAANLMPEDRLVVLRRAQDEPDASRRNLTVGLAALQAWLSLAAAGGVPRLTLLEAQALEGEAVREQLYLLTGTPAGAGQTAGTWNGSGTSAAIYVQGYVTYFGREGVLLDADGQPTARVSVDVEAGTYELLPDLGPIVAQLDGIKTQLDVIAVQGKPVYGFLAAGGEPVGYDSLDESTADTRRKTSQSFNAPTLVLTTSNAANGDGWGFATAALGRTLQLGNAVELTLPGNDVGTLTFQDFYIEAAAGSRNSKVRLLTTAPANTPPALLPRLSGYSDRPFEFVNGGAALLSGYYSSLTGNGTVVVQEPFQADNVAAGVTIVRPGTGRGTVKTVNGIVPNAAGEVTLPTRDIYAVSAAKRNQVLAGFTSNTQVSWADVSLAGDLYGYGARFFDFNGGDWYELAPNPNVPDANGNASPYWTRQA